MSASDPATLSLIESQVALLVEKAMAFGAARERARIAAILHAPLASDHWAFARALACDPNVSAPAAEQALRIAHLSAAPAAFGEAGEPMIN